MVWILAFGELSIAKALLEVSRRRATLSPPEAITRNNCEVKPHKEENVGEAS